MTHNQGLIRLDIRPVQVFVGRYERLPYPNLGPYQELVFEVGIMAAVPVTVTGAVFQLYAAAQLVAERRLSARALAEWVGEKPPLRVVPGEGLAIRRCYFWEPGLEKLTQAFVTIMVRADDGREGQAQWGVPLLYHAQQVELHLPFRGTWWAIMGNDGTDLHKSEPVSQPFAYDFVRLGSDNATFRGTGSHLEDHYSFGAAVVAPAAGEILVSTWDMPDNPPGALASEADLGDDPRRGFGNSLFVAHGETEFSFLAHLQSGSICVRSGEWVERGQLLAHSGNSGLSPGPHLHFHLQNGPHLYVDQGLPVRFSHFTVTGDRVTHSAIPSRLIITPLDEDDPAASLPDAVRARTDED